MKENIKFYIFIIMKFFLISYLIYQLMTKGTYMYYKGLSAFLTLELLEIFIFYTLNEKKINNFKLNFSFFSFFSFFNFFLITYFYYLGEKYIEILSFSSLLLFLNIIYSFLLFLVDRISFYFKYTLVSFIYLLFLIHITVPTNPPKKEEMIYIIGVFYIVYIFIFFLIKEVGEKNINKFLIFIDKEEKKDKNYISFIIRSFIYLLLIYISIKNKDIHYRIILIFITFELFGIVVFYKKIFIKNFIKKIEIYLLFNFLLTIVFYYLAGEFTLFVDAIILCFPFILALLCAIYSLIKRNVFYLIYSLILLLWWIFFIMLNLGGIPPELGTYKLNIFDFFIPYIIISSLYFLLFEKNDKKIIK